MTQVLNESVTLESTNCCVCGVVFALPEALLRHARNNAGSICCPNGHWVGWSETEAQRLKKELLKTQAALDQSRTAEHHRREERDALERSLIAKKGEVTKLRKRIGAGTCPCCHRSFRELATHMQQEHPDYQIETEAMKA